MVCLTFSAKNASNASLANISLNIYFIISVTMDFQRKVTIMDLMTFLITNQLLSNLHKNIHHGT